MAIQFIQVDIRKYFSEYKNFKIDFISLTVLLVRMYIFVLPKAYSLADIGKSLNRQVTPSTDPSPLQCGHVWVDNILYLSKKFSYSSLNT